MKAAWKFLHPSCCTFYHGEPFVYPTPSGEEKWVLVQHPDPGKPDGRACGSGGLHLMKSLNAVFAPSTWWPWPAKYRQKDMLGEDNLKVRVSQFWMGRLLPKHFHRMLRLGWGRGAYLRGADLRGADLRRADLRGADLREADLRGADLRGADLRGADLRGADLREADLRGADLREAYLRGADLRGAYLRGADLRGSQAERADIGGQR